MDDTDFSLVAPSRTARERKVAKMPVNANYELPRVTPKK
jgi:hypothetical protein